jgi:hypothetical protein
MELLQVRAVKADGKFLEASELTKAADSWQAKSVDLASRSNAASAEGAADHATAEQAQADLDGHIAALAKLEILLQQIRRGSQMLRLSKVWEEQHREAVEAADKAGSAAQSCKAQVRHPSAHSVTGLVWQALPNPLPSLFRLMFEYS